jgi:hypothetical protein
MKTSHKNKANSKNYHFLLFKKTKQTGVLVRACLCCNRNAKRFGEPESFWTEHLGSFHVGVSASGCFIWQ